MGEKDVFKLPEKQEMNSPSDSYPSAATSVTTHVPPFGFMVGSQGPVGLSQEERKSILNNLTFLKHGCAKRSHEGKNL